MRPRVPVLVLVSTVVSAVLSVGIGVVGVAASPAVAATGALGPVTVSKNLGSKPKVTFDTPFAVKKTANAVVATGTGAALAAGQKVTFDYVLVDGRTGKQVETSYGRSPASLVLDKAQTAEQLVTGLTGKPVGSRVLVAVAPKDGLAAKLNTPKVKKSDTLLFVIDVKGVRTPLTRATGDAVAPVDGLPTVALADTGKPTVTIPTGVAAPSTLVAQPLIKGTGPAVKAGQTVTVHYTGVIWGSGKQFDSSWDRGQPADFALEKGKIIPGWITGLVGQTVGSQVLLVVPPDQGYGASGNAQAGISGTDTLVFVADILDAY